MSRGVTVEMAGGDRRMRTRQGIATSGLARMRRRCFCVADRRARRSGAIAVATALTLVPLMGAAGVAVDGARGWLSHARLTASLNAAALAGAQALGGGDPPALRRARAEQAARDVFWANFCGVAGLAAAVHCGPRGRGFIGTTLPASAPTVAFDGPGSEPTTIAVSAEAELATTLTRVLGLLPGGTTREALPVRSSAVAAVGGGRLEVALALDVTGSMGRNYRPDSRTPWDFDTSTNIHALRVAARAFVRELHALAADRGVEALISVVPYTTTVNIGRENDRFVDFDAIRPLSSTNARRTWRTTFGLSGRAAYGVVDPRPGFVHRNHDWRGCVEARAEDRTPAELVAPPSVRGRFRPFFYPSTLTDDAERHVVAGVAVPGDNDWCPWEVAGMPLADGTPMSPFSITEHWQWAREDFSTGPNLGCPENAILPLTADRAAAEEAVMRLLSTHRGGTMAHVGLQAAWWTLSPAWREVWPQAPTARGPVPAAEDAIGGATVKAIVLMTDGVNQWFDFNAMAPGRCIPLAAAGPGSGLDRLPGAPNVNVPPFLPIPCPPGADHRDGVDGDYTGLGRFADNPYGWRTHAEARAGLNALMVATCEAIKAQGIRLYTVVFEESEPATIDAYRACASDPTTFFFNPDDPSALIDAFRAIARSLRASTVRLLPPPRS